MTLNELIAKLEQSKQKGYGDFVVDVEGNDKRDWVIANTLTLDEEPNEKMIHIFVEDLEHISLYPKN